MRVDESLRCLDVYGTGVLHFSFLQCAGIVFVEAGFCMRESVRYQTTL